MDINSNNYDSLPDEVKDFLKDLARRPRKHNAKIFLGSVEENKGVELIPFNPEENMGQK